MKLGLLTEKVISWKSEVPENVDHTPVIIDRILGLLGKDLVRNILISIRMNRVLGTNLPRKSKDTTLSLKFEDYVPLGIVAQDYCSEQKLMHTSMAFNAGLHYDWVTTLLNKMKASADQKAQVKEVFKEGFLTARIAYRLAQKMGRMQLDRYVFAGGLVLPLGKVLMHVLFPKDLKEKSYAQFIADCEKHPKGKRFMMEALEHRRFPITHLELSSLLACFGETLRPVELAISQAQHSSYLEEFAPEQMQLASLWEVANMAAQDNLAKLAFSSRQNEFLKKSRLDLDFIKKVAAEARAEKV
jgi:hypothetical protein